MKKFFALVLIVATLLMTTALGAFESSQSVLVSENYLEESNGNAVLYSQGNSDHVLVVTRNGVEEKEYYIDGSKYIQVTSSSGENYTIDKTEIVGAPVVTLASSRPVHFCNITYKTTDDYNGTPMASVEHTSVSATSTYPVTVQKGWLYDDALAAIVGILLDEVLPSASDAANMAEILLDSMMSAAGADIVDGVISHAFYDTFRAAVVTYSYQATLSVGSSVVGTTELNEAGSSVVVFYDDVGEFDKKFYEYAPTRIPLVQNRFATDIWNGCSPYDYPGCLEYDYTSV